MSNRKDVEKIDLQKAGTWLSGEVEIRLPRVWLAVGLGLVVVLLILALD